MDVYEDYYHELYNYDLILKCKFVNPTDYRSKNEHDTYLHIGSQLRRIEDGLFVDIFEDNRLWNMGFRLVCYHNYRKQSFEESVKEWKGNENAIAVGPGFTTLKQVLEAFDILVHEEHFPPHSSSSSFSSTAIVRTDNVDFQTYRKELTISLFIFEANVEDFGFITIINSIYGNLDEQPDEVTDYVAIPYRSTADEFTNTLNSESYIVISENGRIVPNYNNDEHYTRPFFQTSGKYLYEITVTDYQNLANRQLKSPFYLL
jgi:hypothetical protein